MKADCQPGQEGDFPESDNLVNTACHMMSHEERIQNLFTSVTYTPCLTGLAKGLATGFGVCVCVMVLLPSFSFFLFSFPCPLLSVTLRFLQRTTKEEVFVRCAWMDKTEATASLHAAYTNS